MEDIITKSSVEYKELVDRMRTAFESLVRIRQQYRPPIGGERYLTGHEVRQWFHISPRTLQNLRDNRMIAYTTVGGKILYPEKDLLKILEDNYIPVEPTY